MPGSLQRGPLGVSCPDDPGIEDGTLCRAVAFAPVTTGTVRVADGPLDDRPLAAARRTTLRTRHLRFGSVDDYLGAMGKPGAPAAVRERVRIAAAFFENIHEGIGKTISLDDVANYLRGVDFSHEVEVKRLAEVIGPNQVLIQRLSPGSRPGNFFAASGYSAKVLGVAEGDREIVRFMLKNPDAEVLVSKTTGVLDSWTSGRQRQFANIRAKQRARQAGGTPNPGDFMGELAAGGGVQIVIPSPVDRQVVRLP